MWEEDGIIDDKKAVIIEIILVFILASLVLFAYYENERITTENSCYNMLNNNPDLFRLNESNIICNKNLDSRCDCTFIYHNKTVEYSDVRSILKVVR